MSSSARLRASSACSAEVAYVANIVAVALVE